MFINLCKKYLVARLISHCYDALYKGCSCNVAGRSIHVMTFEVGAALEDAKWQAPVYCFENKKPNEHPASEKSIVDIGFLEYESNGILREFV